MDNIDWERLREYCDNMKPSGTHRIGLRAVWVQTGEISACIDSMELQMMGIKP